MSNIYYVSHNKFKQIPFICSVKKIILILFFIPALSFAQFSESYKEFNFGIIGGFEGGVFHLVRPSRLEAREAHGPTAHTPRPAHPP